MDRVDRELERLNDGARSAHADQTTEGVRDLARQVGAFRNQCVLDGFRQDEAYELSRDWFGALLEAAPADEDED